jgi:flavin-dependent dehydrogenase
MRYAITSGYLAAKSIISKKDYKKIVEKKFKNKIRAGFVNRYIFEKIIDKDSSIIINKLDYLKKNLYSFYNYNLRQRIFYPLAVRSLNKKYPNLEL